MKLLKQVSLVLVFAFSALFGSLALAEPVNVNTADAAALSQNLKGVGPAKARAIIEWREQNGPFKSTEDLAQVKGIGEVILEVNKDNIAFN